MKNKGMNLEKCIEKADEFIHENGECLLLFDVIGSKKHKGKDRHTLQKKLTAMYTDINKQFDNYFHENKLASGTIERGFYIVLGDGAYTGINSSKIISKIIKYQNKNYPNIPLRYGIAKNGYDDENLKIVR